MRMTTTKMPLIDLSANEFKNCRYKSVQCKMRKGAITTGHKINSFFACKFAQQSTTCRCKVWMLWWSFHLSNALGFSVLKFFPDKFLNTESEIVLTIIFELGSMFFRLSNSFAENGSLQFS